MGHYEKIGDVAGGQGDIQENYHIETGEIKGGFWLEEYINKQSGLVDKAFVKNSVGEVIEFVDWGALEKSEPLNEFIKAHYLNEGIVLNDEAVKKAAESLADAVSNNMLNRIDENKKIAN